MGTANGWHFIVPLLLHLSLAACQERPLDHKTISTAKQMPESGFDKDNALRTDSTLLATLQTNFTIGTRGYELTQGTAKYGSRMDKISGENSAGIRCKPINLDLKSSKIAIELPHERSSRRGVLAVIVPDGSLRIVYQSYPDDVESIDLIIPSKSIDWMSAWRGSAFMVDARAFEALMPGESRPRPLFQEAGVYQFGLLNDVPDSFSINDDAPVKVIAGCVVHWQP